MSLLALAMQNQVIRAGGQPLRLGAWRAHDSELQRRFSDAGAAEESNHVWLFRYLLTGFLEWRSADGARAFYPGLPSNHGADLDAIEGFSRFAPLIGAWLAAGRSSTVETLEGKPIDLPALLLEGFTAGTDPGGPGYWGVPTKTDQRICEAADIALALWLSRDAVWPGLDSAQQGRIFDWLGVLASLRVHDNNWHLFTVIIVLTLAKLEAGTLPPGGRTHYARVREFHLGQGWFADGNPLQIDYYNAWGFHYPLFWVGELAPQLDPTFLATCLQEFAAGYKFLISPRGLPMIGRSVTYRLAVPAPLIAAQRRYPDVIAPGLARRALAAVWAHFVACGALRAGIVTQGYEASEPALLDPYSGPASPLWSLRSLILALYEPSSAPFWTAPLQPLPIEEKDYTLSLPPIGWEIEGRRSTGEIVIRRSGEIAEDPFIPAPVPARWHPLFGRPLPRPANFRARYLRREYSSARPFWRNPA
ncbi:MAG TPA: DUF2264 domain-containing protein [Hypericibacter adhaerens]|uniref:DUF2264 domain-containing protein n=1 Tax=Hypericibacter adhaerens TaxID=2602016 RepID=UPI002C62BFA1|nr:DUF2264 domain-containing protein [Hypericibacter adhaerens]HWA46017.1 DUF2264 domain-containing protein [Hypericibacter adhaerens]